MRHFTITMSDVEYETLVASAATDLDDEEWQKQFTAYELGVISGIVSEHKKLLQKLNEVV